MTMGAALPANTMRKAVNAAPLIPNFNRLVLKLSFVGGGVLDDPRLYAIYGMSRTPSPYRF